MAAGRRGAGVVGTTLLILTISSTIGQHNQPFQSNPEHKIDGEVVNMWGTRFGTELWESLTRATRRDEIQKGYDSHSDLRVDEIDGFDMVKKMAAEVQVMMQHKIDAIKRIMELAENIALDHKYDKDRGERLKEGRYTYHNAKKLNVLPEDDEGGGDEYGRYLSQYRDQTDEFYAPGHSRMALTANKHFSGIPVNTSFSSVHVPTNVFDGEPKVINAIDWSRKLDDTFKDNYQRDPSLSWQYFGSSTGFLRQYPAMKWLMYEDDPDMYDARMRDWYIKSAASPKDIVILLDKSGSMTGLRKEIAKHVVLNIMETLGEDDFVTVLTFSDETRPLVECFTDENGEPELVQATTENIAEFTEAVNNIETMEIANFTSALTEAFTLLERYRTKKIGAESNQAIMLVTDGVPYTYETIFQEYNQPHKPVRVFTYLIGREISDLEAAKWMACENKGYFTHVTTLAEVKEQVLKYIPVMARPLVLLRETHPVRWTGVYADIEVPNDRSLWVIGLKKPKTRKRIHELQGKEGSFKGYKLMTSVSIPVYNKKNHTTIEVLGLKPNEIANPFGQVRIAELLGVAGTDVPIAEIEKLIPPYKLGVNGYSFAVNNNGYILYHPDLRPMFQEILKPNYNSVDLAEVELVHNDKHEEPRYNDSALYMMRKEMVDQKDGLARLTVKVHMDDMKRVTIREQDYFYYNISNTPFTLGIVMPSKYGKYRVSGGLELNQNRHIDANKIFPDDRWKLHPDWVYCEYNYAGTDDRKFDSPEKNMKHFLERLADEKASFNWGQSRVRPLPKCQGNGYYQADCPKLLEKREVQDEDNLEGEVESDDLGEDEDGVVEESGLDVEEPFDPIINKGFCDKELVQALVLDGEVTKIFTDEKSRSNKKDLFKQFGIELSFVATRSGLTRWEEHKEKDEFATDEYDDGYDPDNPREPHFSEVNNEATDEVWYKRAVEYHYNNPDSFVFSVPFDIGDKRPTTVTATHAIYKEMNGRKAPAAVVGVQIDYDKFAQNFIEVTTGSGGAGYKTASGEMLSCQNETIECYVLDNNGFVVISEDPSNIGKFFGEIDGTILKSLEQNHVFKKIKIYDYQAICLENADDGSPANIILTPFKLIAWMFNWILGQMAMTIIRFEIHHLWNPDWTYALPYPQVDPDYAYPDYSDGYQYDDDVLYEAEPNGPPIEETPVVSDDDGEATVVEPFDEFQEEVLDNFKMKDGGPIPLLEMTYINKTQPKPCDKESYLYELNETALKLQRPLQGILRNCHESNCERPFSVTLIPNTNLVLIVADKMCPCYSARISVNPTKVDYGPKNETTYCEKLKTNLYRQKPRPSVFYHPQEEEISLCGGSSHLALSALLISFSVIYHLVAL
eukprot:TRINITY_DN369_c0_g1_i1.p1 TRINITY_DN369_c0_g1~~TRINITY_DN369_c0_g1_i1.p1  ORF type:complete len:1359 (+),score=332.60 TRINITY_DN369_c0_g1_i1:336-4412(+)